MRHIFFAIAFLCLATPTFAQICERPLTLGWSEWPPYHYEEQGSLRGISTDLAVSSLRHAGCEVRFKQLPWNRLLLAVQTGQVDLAAGMQQTTEREAFGRFSVELGHQFLGLYVRRDQLRDYPWRQLQDMVGTSFRLGVRLNVNYGEEFRALRPQLEAHGQLWVNPSSTNPQMLAMKRLDGMLLDVMVEDEVLTGRLREIIALHPMRVLYANPTRLLFSKATVSAELVEHINQSIRALQADGTHEQILKRYLPDNTSLALLNP
jgi:polar amino acid transport system substrate-binding protein